MKSPYLLFVLALGLSAILETTVEAQRIYWVDSRTPAIKRANADGSDVESIVTEVTINDPSGVALDVAAGKIYWAAQNGIFRSNLDGTSVEGPILTGTAYGIALDLAVGKVYWTDHSKIRRANLDGSQVEEVVASEEFGAWAIALDSHGGKMYWTYAQSGVGTIRRANLDGSNVEELVISDVVYPSGIALDLSTGKMYWTDEGRQRIRRANLDGSDAEDIVDSSSDFHDPTAIVVDSKGGKIYWGDLDGESILRANLDGSNIEQLLDSRKGPLTPSGLALDSASGKVYWTDEDNDRISRSNLDGSEIEILVQRVDLLSPAGLAIDRARGKLYWADYLGSGPGVPGEIRRAFLNGAINERVLGFPGRQPGSIAFDPAHGKMYWSEAVVLGCGGISCSYSFSLRRADLDGSNAQDQGGMPSALVSFGPGPTPPDLVLDVEAGIAYWASEGIIYRVDVKTFPNGVLEEFITTGAARSIALDAAAAGKLYWTTSGGSIQRADLDGFNIEDVVTGEAGPIDDIALDPRAGKIYWAMGGMPQGIIRRANSDGSEKEDAVTGTGSRQPTNFAVDFCERDDAFRIAEHEQLVNCMAGPAAVTSGDCYCADLSGNARVDLMDYAIAQRAFRGP